jgi:hypothetical protein
MATLQTLLLNSRVQIQTRYSAGKIHPAQSVLMLFSRLVLFGLFQALAAVIFTLLGSSEAWQASIAWWPVTATLANLVNLLLLTVLARNEGMRLIDLYRVEKHNIGKELLVVLGFLVLAAPISMLPNIAIGNWLFGDVNLASALMFRPLPRWVIYMIMVAFPITIALSEMPNYYSYVMPRLEAMIKKPWLAVGIAGVFHALQHVTLPLIFDVRFILWRLLMFLPFALFVATILRLRPRQLPYMLVVHALMDSSLAFYFLAAS